MSARVLITGAASGIGEATTVATPLHDASSAAGVRLAGAVPEERLADAARTLARAALDRPVRDLATTRRGAGNYRLARHAPRRLLDLVVRTQMKRLTRRGHFKDSELARDVVARSGR